MNNKTVSINNKPLIFFLLINFLLFFADSVVSFTVPVYINSLYKNALIVGFAVSLSSIAKLGFDFLSGNMFRNKDYDFFLKVTILFSVLFSPILILFKGNALTLILAMIVWGIYYEGIAFTRFNFFKKHVVNKEYTKIFGVSGVLRHTAYFVGTLIASYLLSINLNLPLYLTFAVFLIPLLILSIEIRKKTFNFHNNVKKEIKSDKVSDEIKAWKILMKKVWSLWLFTIVFDGLRAMIWTIGVLYSNELAESSAIGNFLVPAFMAPYMIFGLFSDQIAHQIGKKRTAFWAALGSGLFIILAGLTSVPFLVVLLIFLSSIFSALTRPALWAQYEEYIHRVGKYHNDMIGIEQSAYSLAFIIIPVVFGWIAQNNGNQFSVFFYGTFLVIASVFALLFVPKSIKMPQKELASLEVISEES